MWRFLLAVLIGLGAGGCVIGLIELIGSWLHPMPSELSMEDTEALQQWIAELPVSAFLIVMVAWWIGCFVAALVARYVAKGRSAFPAWVAVGLLLVAIVFNLFALPSPWWMWLLGLVGSMVAGTLGVGLIRPSELFIEADRLIHAPKAEVFELVARIENYSKAIATITNVEFLSDRRFGVGTKFIETRSMNGREASVTLEVTEFDEPHKVRLVSDEGGTVWDTVFRFSEDETDSRDGLVERNDEARLVASRNEVGGRATKLTMRMDVRPYKLLANLMTPLLMGMIGKAIEMDMDAVKHHCESTRSRPS